MTTDDAPSPKWVELMAPLVRGVGFTPTPLSGVSLVHGLKEIARTPLLYEPSLFILAQGSKTGYLGDREIHYTPGQYLVQTLPMPFECETHASPEEPLYGLSVRLEPAMLSELVHAMARHRQETTNEDPLPMASVPMTAGMKDAVERLLATLHHASEVEVMGEARIRDVIFEALRGEQGPALEALVLNRGNYSRIARVLSDLHQSFAEDLTVEQLARRVNMSPSTFHEHFKAITRTSPVQYIKRLRLIKAQQLLNQDAFNVNQTALAVGYRSSPQFSRDFKRYFGESPLRSRQAR